MGGEYCENVYPESHKYTSPDPRFTMGVTRYVNLQWVDGAVSAEKDYRILRVDERSGEFYYKVEYGPFSSMESAVAERNRTWGIGGPAVVKVDGRWYMESAGSFSNSNAARRYIQSLKAPVASRYEQKSEKKEAVIIKKREEKKQEVPPAPVPIPSVTIKTQFVQPDPGLQDKLKAEKERADALQKELDKQKAQPPQVVEKVVVQQGPERVIQSEPQIIEREKPVYMTNVVVRTQVVERVVEKIVEVEKEPEAPVVQTPAVENPRKKQHAVDPFMNLSDGAMANIGIDYTEYVSKRTSLLPGRSAGVITTKSTENDANVKQYLDLCETLVTMADLKKVDQYYRAINKILGGRAVEFGKAYEIEQKYKIIGAASLALFMAYAGEPSLQNLNESNLFVSVYQLNVILKELGK